MVQHGAAAFLKTALLHILIFDMPTFCVSCVSAGFESLTTDLINRTLFCSQLSRFSHFRASYQHMNAA